MSLPPWQDPGNPGNPNSIAFQQMLQQINTADGVNRDETNLDEHPLMAWILLGLFGGLVILNLLIM